MESAVNVIVHGDDVGGVVKPAHGHGVLAVLAAEPDSDQTLVNLAGWLGGERDIIVASGKRQTQQDQGGEDTGAQARIMDAEGCKYTAENHRAACVAGWHAAGFGSSR
jgi:hypothetical protein